MTLPSNRFFRSFLSPLHAVGLMLGVGVAVLWPLGCAGPVPLHLAIDPQDETAYVAALNAANGDASRGFAEWMATERGISAKAVLTADARFSATRNPFSARSDRRAVSRGAVIYKIHCVRCHGEDSRGHGPSTLPGTPATDFKTFGKRFTATLHGGAPRKWFGVIRDGSGEVVDYPDERTTAMPPFAGKLTREQTWQVITYLQSLDVHAGTGAAGASQ